MTLGEDLRHTAQVGTDGELAALVQRAKSSDPDAWEALYRRAYPGLLAYAARRLDADRARDAVAETLARAVAQIRRFRWDGSGFDAWLYGILRHIVVDAYRAASRDAARCVPSTPDGLEPLEYVLHDEEATAVRVAFARLSRDEQDVLELRVVVGLSAENAGRVLGKRPGAVRMAQARALARLRRELAHVEAGR